MGGCQTDQLGKYHKNEYPVRWHARVSPSSVSPAWACHRSERPRRQPARPTADSTSEGIEAEEKSCRPHPDPEEAGIGLKLTETRAEQTRFGERVPPEKNAKPSTPLRLVRPETGLRFWPPIFF